MKKKTQLIVCVLVVIALMIIGGAIWWFTPSRFLSHVEPSEIARIEVFNGNDGNRFTVTEASDIDWIARHIQEVPMEKDSISMGMGTTYNLRFLDANGKEMERFIIMSPTTVRSGLLFYVCDGALKPVEDYLIELERQQFPDTDWIKNQSN